MHYFLYDLMKYHTVIKFSNALDSSLTFPHPIFFFSKSWKQNMSKDNSGEFHLALFSQILHQSASSEPKTTKLAIKDLLHLL